MHPADFYLIQQMMEIRVAEQLREAETRRLIRQMGGGLPARTGRWLLCRLGRTLVSLGQQMQQSYAPCCSSAGRAGE